MPAPVEDQALDGWLRSAYTILRAILDTAVRDGALAVNPAAVIRRPKVVTTEAPT